MKKMIVDPTAPYSYAQLLRDIIGLQAAYPALITSANAGYSAEGRQLPLLTLGTGKTKAFFCAAHHAREYISSAYLMYMVNVFARAAMAGKKLEGYDMRKLLSECTVYIMPMVNPDGVSLAQGGLKAVQYPDRVASMVMLSPSYCGWKANINGVDLNLNYPALWEQRHTMVKAPASELFKGEDPFTEPEVKAVKRVCKKNVFKSAISFHTGGEAIGYSDKDTDEKIPAAKALAERLAGVSGYRLIPVSDDSGSYEAGFENWFRQEFLYPGLMITLAPKMGGAVPHSDRDFFSLIWNKAKYICAEAIKATIQQ